MLIFTSLHSFLTQLGAVTKFVAENRNYLRQYESSYCLVLNAAANVQKNDTIFDALRVIGVLLLIRDVSTRSPSPPLFGSSFLTRIFSSNETVE